MLNLCCRLSKHEAACLQVQDVVLVVAGNAESDGSRCSMLHTGAITIDRVPQPEQHAHQLQVLHQLQQHIVGQHTLSAGDLQRLLVEVCMVLICMCSTDTHSNSSKDTKACIKACIAA